MNKESSESGSNFCEEKVDPARLNNNLYFTGEMNESSSYKFLYLLHQLEHEKIAVLDKQCNLYINSSGGTCTSGLLMYDALRNSPLDITVIAPGFIGSSATIVLLGRDKRLCTPNTNFLIHPISTFACGRLPDVKNRLAYGQILEDQFFGIYQKHTKISRDMMQEETYFSSSKALDIQLVSKII